MARYELKDFEWRAIKPVLPNKPRGVPRVDDRRVLNGIFWILRTGSPWRDVDMPLMICRLFFGFDPCRSIGISGSITLHSTSARSLRPMIQAPMFVS